LGNNNLAVAVSRFAPLLTSNTANGHESEAVSSSTLTTHLSKTHLIIVIHLPQLEALDSMRHVFNSEPHMYDPEIQFNRDALINSIPL
jgi:hypothetical protein